MKQQNVLIEKTAAELAGTYYEEMRSQGMTSKYKNARQFAKANIEKFIPLAVNILMSMLNRADISDHMKNEIYEAFLERSNDPDLIFMDQNPMQHKTILHS